MILYLANRISKKLLPRRKSKGSESCNKENINLATDPHGRTQTYYLFFDRHDRRKTIIAIAKFDMSLNKPINYCNIIFTNNINWNDKRYDMPAGYDSNHRSSRSMIVCVSPCVSVAKKLYFFGGSNAFETKYSDNIHICHSDASCFMRRRENDRKSNL